MADLGPCMAEHCGNPASVYLAGPTLGPSPRVTIIGGHRAAASEANPGMSLHVRCVDCACHAVERIASEADHG